MILVKNNTFHLYGIKFDFKTIYFRAPDSLRKKSGLRSALVIILVILPLLTGCGSAFVASRQDDIVTQIDVWSAENEYGKAFATLDYVKTSHPQYQELQLRKKTLLTQAGEYEQRIDKQIQKLIKANQWAQALDLLDQAKEKYPLTNDNSKNRGLEKTEKSLLAQQQKSLASIDQDIMLQRSQWMIKTRPVYQKKLNTDPRSELLKKQVESLNNEAKLLAEKLTQLSKEAMEEKHYKTARTRINQAIALESNKQRQQILSQLQSREKKSYKKKKQTESRSHKIQQNTILEDIEKSFKAGDYLVVKELILKLDENEQKNIQIIQLKQELDYSIDYKIEQLVSEANKNYTNGQFYQAIELWEQVLIYDPQNTRAKKNIRRAEEVINKLIRLREKQ